MPAQGLSLTAQNAYNALVGMPSTQCAGRTLVTPSQPAESYLVNKITGVDICFGTQMPKIGSLTAAEQALIQDWVRTGALNN